jgi:hypothetical protein
LLATVAACSDPGAQQASAVAEAFERASASDMTAACLLLSDATRDQLEKSAKQACEQALPEEELPEPSTVRSVDVYGRDAMVRLDGDTMFLARFADGWRVTAAACQPGPTPESPYECNLEGR